MSFTIQSSCRVLVESLLGSNAGSLGNFYRAVYKGTDNGPGIGFCINGKWVYNEDLYKYENTDDFWEENDVTGVMISPYVEGSEVEVQSRTFTKPFITSQFWEANQEGDEEARFYWERDNSDWYMLEAPNGDFDVSKVCWGEWVHGIVTPEAVKKALEAMYSDDELPRNEEDYFSLPGGWKGRYYISEAIW